MTPIEGILTFFLICEFFAHLLLNRWLINHSTQKIEERIDRVSQKLQKLTLEVHQVFGRLGV